MAKVSTYITITLALISATSVMMVVFNDLRIKITILSIQYLAVFLLVNQSWPFELAIIKLLAGWTTCVILGLSLYFYGFVKVKWRAIPFSRYAFQFLASSIIFIIVFVVSQPLAKIFVVVPKELLFGGGVLIGNGLIMGISSKTLDKIFGILMFLEGFEIIYSAVEISTLVASLLAAITLGVAIVGSYIYSFRDVGSESK